jgi:hypothetical protein
MVSLISFLDENARRRPDHLACLVGDDSLSCTGGGISGYDHAVCTIHVLTAT